MQMRPLIALFALFIASTASAQDRPELSDAYRSVRVVGVASVAAPVGGLALTGAMTMAGVDDDASVMPFGLALLVGAPVLTWSANRGRRLLEQDNVSIGGLMGDLATVSSIVYGCGFAISMSEVIDGDGAIGVMVAGLVGSYGFGMAQWAVNERSRPSHPDWQNLGSSARRSPPPVSLTMRW